MLLKQQLVEWIYHLPGYIQIKYPNLDRIHLLISYQFAFSGIKVSDKQKSITYARTHLHSMFSHFWGSIDGKVNHYFPINIISSGFEK